MRCPMCGEKFNPADAMMDADWLEIISDVMPTFGAHAKLALEYVEKFGTNPIRMKGKKILRLLKEVQKLFTGGRFVYQKKTYRISSAAVVASIGTVNNREFDRPLTNHNYLKQVMIQAAKDELKQKRVGLDRELKKREDGGRMAAGSVRRFEDDEISIDEFARQTKQDISKLAGKVGRKME